MRLDLTSRVGCDGIARDTDDAVDMVRTPGGIVELPDDRI